MFGLSALVDYPISFYTKNTTERHSWEVDNFCPVTWATLDYDLCDHMVPLGHSELKVTSIAYEVTVI